MRFVDAVRARSRLRWSSVELTFQLVSRVSIKSVLRLLARFAVAALPCS